MPAADTRPRSALYSKPYLRLALSNFLMITGVGCGLVYPLFVIEYGGG